jgi:hypothetical protein
MSLVGQLGDNDVQDRGEFRCRPRKVRNFIAEYDHDHGTISDNRGDRDV